MTSKPPIREFSQVAPIMVQRYESYLPTAFDPTLSLLEKLNHIIEYMNRIGKITNDLIEQWNDIVKWVISDGLEEATEKLLNDWFVNGKLKELFYEIEVNLKYIGVYVADYDSYKVDMGDGKYDYAPAINKAMEVAIERNAKLCLTPYVEYTIYSPITFDISKISVDGMGSTIDAKNVTGGSAIHVIGTEYPPYSQVMNKIGNFKIQNTPIGERVNGCPIGLLLDVDALTTTGAINSISHVLFHNIDIEGFDKGLFLGANSYLVKFDKVDIHHCNTNIYIPANGDNSRYTNMGENYKFDHCTIYGAYEYLLHLRADTAYFNFDSCSFDYPAASGQWGLIEKSTHVVFNTCFFEGGYGNVSEIPFIIREFAVVVFNTPSIYFSSGGTYDPKFPYFVQNDSQYPVLFENARVRSFKTTTGFFAKGRIKAKNTVAHFTEYMQLADNPNNSLLPDINTLSVIEQYPNIWVTDATSAISHIKRNATEVSFDTEYMYNNKKTLRITKKENSTGQKFFMAFKTHVDYINAIDGFFKFAPDATGYIKLSIRYANLKDVILPNLSGNNFNLPQVQAQSFMSTLDMRADDYRDWTKFIFSKMLNGYARYDYILCEIDLSNLNGYFNIGGITASQM